MQVSVLHDLLHIATGGEVAVHTHINMDFESVDHQTTFAVLLYHRWALKSYMSGSLVTKQPRLPFIPM